MWGVANGRGLEKKLYGRGYINKNKNIHSAPFRISNGIYMWPRGGGYNSWSDDVYNVDTLGLTNTRDHRIMF